MGVKVSGLDDERIGAAPIHQWRVAVGGERVSARPRDKIVAEMLRRHAQVLGDEIMLGSGLVEPVRGLVGGVDMSVVFLYTSVMEFEWDKAKREQNLRKHNVDFADVWRVFEGEYLTREDRRFVYDEIRFQTIGWLYGTPVLVIHTEVKPNTARLISVRRLTKYERQEFFN